MTCKKLLDACAIASNLQALWLAHSARQNETTTRRFRATKLVGRPVAVIGATGGEPAVQAAKAATSTIPIVFATGVDPVKQGLVASFNRPGGNVTGIVLFAAQLEPKRLGLLRDLAPQASTVGILLNPNFPASERSLLDIQEAAAI
jgi:putative ABC transport system substrate-binding protein